MGQKPGDPSEEGPQVGQAKEASCRDANDEPASCGCCTPATSSQGLTRREFVKLAGLGVVSTSIGRPATIMSGPFGAADLVAGHLVPADKQLDPAWLASLAERGAKEVYRGDALKTIGMPCGGIATGQLYLCGDGTLGDWQIFNNAVSYWVEGTHSTYAHSGIAKPVAQGFAVSVRAPGGQTHLRPLNRDGFADVEFQGEYPIGIVRYADPESPVRVEMEAFSPFIPLNAKDSALPATLFLITAENVTSQNILVSIEGWLQNAVCLHYGREFDGLRTTRLFQDHDCAYVTHGAQEAPPPKETSQQDEERPPILFEDFEGDDYGTWTAEGNAFGREPVSGTLPNQQPVSGFHGKGLVNTFLGGDDTRGTLTSPSFTISRRYINFLVGGGAHSERTCINLEIDGEVVRTATGQNRETLAWRSWPVVEFEGQEARLAIVDNAGGGWGHINIDHIEFADTKRDGDPVPMGSAPDLGTMTLACCRPFWSTLLAEGTPPVAIPNGLVDDQGPERDFSFDIRENRTGLLATRWVKLRPGKTHCFVFAIAWHFPNQPNGHEYARRFADAVEVAQYVLNNRDRLTSDTRLWRDTYYDSTLPYWLLDRLHSTVSCLATGTCQWWENGRFWAYEGVTCCHGTCAHVWNYAQAHARLFPELARSIREMQDFAPRERDGGFHPDTGLVGFRSDDNYAADGQCGTILKAYREHLTSPDGAFLERNWPRIKKALEFSIAHDANDDGLIEDTQHNTYDINFHGANTFVGALYLAALRAGEEMAREIGDAPFAARVHAIFERGRERTVERLWEGEYFIQDVDLDAHPRHQYGHGCLSDHLFGQGWAHQIGLGHLYPQECVRTALQSIWKYNWAPDVAPYNEQHKPFRWFITPGQAGLFTCTWPKSAYLPEGTLYRNEVWTGAEYQVAGHMIWERMPAEALAICRAVHDRYHAELRNPYNEVECGDHYARAMASWGVFLALAGFEYHGPHGHIGFAPRISPERFRAAFTAAEGWGSFTQTRTRNQQRHRIDLRWGRLRIQSMAFELPADRVPSAVRVTLKRRPLETQYECAEGRLLVRLKRGLVLEQGNGLDALIRL